MAARPTNELDVPVGFARRVAYLLGPIALTAAIVGVIYLVAGARAMNEVLVVGAASLMGAGTAVIFGKAAISDELFRLHLDTWDLAWIVMFVNSASAFWYTWNLDLLQKLPGVGPPLRLARRNAVATLKQRPWIRRWAVVGVGLFVITPLPGSGALGGSLMGRIVGVSRFATWTSVTLSGVLVAWAYAEAAGELEARLDQFEQFLPPWVRLVTAVLIVAMMLWLMTKLIRWFATHPPE